MGGSALNSGRSSDRTISDYTREVWHIENWPVALTHSREEAQNHMVCEPLV